MAVPAGPTEQRYTGNGVSTIYTVPFLVIQASDLAVYVNGVKLTSGYTQAGVGNPTSTVTFALAPAIDAQIILALEVPFERINDYQENGDFLASTVNRDFDRIWQALKQLVRLSGRVLTLGKFDIDGQGWYRANGNGIRDLANPVQDQDATTVSWVSSFVSNAIAAVQGPINNALNIFYQWPDGSPHVVQDLSAPNGGNGVGFRQRSVGQRLLDEKVSILDYGAKPQDAYSEFLQNDRAAWNLAVSAAGSSGTVHFPETAGWAETHYWIGTGALNMSVCRVTADPSVVLHVEDIINVVSAPRRNQTAITISRNYPGRTGTYGFKMGQTEILDEYLGAPSAIWSAMESGKHFRDRIPLTTFDPIRISNFATGAYTEDGTGMQSQSAASVNWSNGAAAGADHQGIMKKAPTQGITYEFLMEVPNTNGVAGTFNIVLGRASTTHRWEFTLGSSIVSFYNGTSLVGSFTVLNLMDRVAADVGCIRVGIRMLQNNAAELIINDAIYDTQAVASPIRYLAFVVSQTARPSAALRYHNQTDRLQFASGRPLNVLCIGDSQTAGANASATWPRMLEQLATHLPGIGQLKVTNIAVSGTSSSYWAGQVASINFAPYDRVLIMLGVNDNQSLSNTGLGAFLTNVGTISSKVIADGSRPIWGLGTRYTAPAQSGGGRTTFNHGVFARYNAVLKDYCEVNSLTLAETIETFGNNAGVDGSFTGEYSPSWHADNLHPNSYGQLAIAAAFSAALSRDVSRRFSVASLRAGSLTLAAPWVVHSLSTGGYPRWNIRDGVLYLRGTIRRDPATPAVPVINTTIATLPSFIPISATADVIVRTQGGAVNGFCELIINENGSIIAGPNALPDKIDISASILL